MRRETRRGAGTDLSVLVWDAMSPARRAVVLLPATGLTAKDWSEVAVDLSRDRTVHAVDLRGHGRSAWPGTYSVELMTADVLALLESTGEEVDLVGHSLGGLVACRVAARSPLVRRLVLEDVGLLRPRMPAAPARPEGHLAFDWAVVEQVRPEVDSPAADWPEVLASIAVPVLAVSGGRAASSRRSGSTTSSPSCREAPRSPSTPGTRSTPPGRASSSWRCAGSSTSTEPTRRPDWICSGASGRRRHSGDGDE